MRLINGMSDNSIYTTFTLCPVTGLYMKQVKCHVQMSIILDGLILYVYCLSTICCDSVLSCLCNICLSSPSSCSYRGPTLSLLIFWAVKCKKIMSYFLCLESVDLYVHCSRNWHLYLLFGHRSLKLFKV